MARARHQLDPSPPEEEQGSVQNLNNGFSEEKPYAEYRVRFYENRMEAEIVCGLERLSPGKVQRSQRFLFKEIHRKRRAIYWGQVKQNEQAQASLRQDAAERGQDNVR